MTETRHPARRLSERERGDYFGAVAALALGGQGPDATAGSQLDTLRVALVLPDDAARRALAAWWSSTSGDACGALARFTHVELRLACLIDVISLMFADARLAKTEVTSIVQLARQLNLTVADVVLVGRYVERVVQGRREEMLARRLAQALPSLWGAGPS